MHQGDLKEVTRPTLEPSAVGQFIAVDECPQFHKYEFDAPVAQERQSERNWKEAFEPLSLLLAKDGRDFESAIRGELSAVAHAVVDHSHIEEWEHSQRALENVLTNVAGRSAGGLPTIVSEARLGLQIEAWPIVGDADLLVCWPTGDGIRIRVLDIKAAHEAKTYQQIQVAIYTLLFRQFLESLSPDYEWIIEGGVLHRGTSIESSRPDALPSFSLDAREQDVRRLLQPGGQFDEYYAADNESVRYQLAPKCHGCAYKEACFTEAIEARSTALLGISRGEQERLAQHGVKTLEDLAGLAYPPQDPKPYEYEELTPANRATYDEILSEPGLGERLPEYIQHAQALLAKLNPEFPHTPKTDRRAPWLVGSGRGELPADDPPFDVELPFPRGTLIRTYIHVEWDHRRDRIVMLSAYITASELSRTEPYTVSKVIDDLPDDEEIALEREAELLKAFFSHVFAGIRALSSNLDHGTSAPFHFYVYSSDELNTLIDALKRQDDQPFCHSIRDLFGLRGGLSESAVDQSMVSIVQSEIHDRIALPIPNSGLLPVMDYFQPSEDFFPRSAWTYTRSDGVEVNLREAFHHKLFDFAVPFDRTPEGLHLQSNSDDPDGYYPSRARQGSHIPLEYIWAALGKLTDEWISDVREEYEGYQSIAPFRWVDRAAQTIRLGEEDISALGERLARCVAHVERGVNYRNPSITKSPLELSRLESFSLGERGLGRACREYLQLEYTSNRSELLTHYALPVTQRVQRGEAIPFVVQEAYEDDDNRLQVEGKLLYDQMFEDGDRIAAACRQKGAAGATGGSWMVANELTRQGEPAQSSNPVAIERGPGMTIEELDIPNRSIRLSAIEEFTPWDLEFKQPHRDWTTEESDADSDTVYFGPGQLFVLDPRSDDLTAQRAYNILQEAQSHSTCQLLERLALGNGSLPEYTMIDASSVTRFLDELATTAPVAPNPEQRAFIEATDAKIALLQGPPGTGKTAGALAPAALSRVVAYEEQGTALTGLVTGESNKAVNELLDDTATLLETHSANAIDEFPDVKLVRLVNETPDEPHPAVEYVNYHRDRDAVATLATLLTPNQGASESSDNRPHLLLFTTPARLYGLTRKIPHHGDSISPPERLRTGSESFFDLLIADEASMMRLSSFLLASAFMKEASQILVGGDQRQLPPVRVHDWEEESRRSVREFAPYLSTLDYLRALRDASLDVLPDESVISGDVDIPLFQLERTYRCHTTVADFLQRNVYAADNIEYRSTERDRINTVSAPTDALATVLDPELPLVVVVHSDTQHQQSNPVEAAIGAAISNTITDADTTGVVTPHNAQRGLFSTLVTGDTEVDTVERYQGGERDCIIVSATASDPDFLAAEQEFILNPNRLNVAMSRMKRKLIVLASESVFGLVPIDIDVYERATLWKALYGEAGVIDTQPSWDGQLSDFLPRTIPGEHDPAIQVYTFSSSI